MKKKKKVIKRAKTKTTYDLYLCYTEHRSGGEATNPEEEFSSREPEYIEFTPLSCYHFMVSESAFLNKLFCEYSNADYRHHKIEFDPKGYDSLYAVIVRYTTGDTFGSTYGAWEVASLVLTRKEAEKIKKDIEKETGDYDPNLKGYHPWNGYFESLEGVGIHKLDIICHA